MALVSDKRGSNDQRTLFNWTRELYPSSKVHYEYALPDGSRIDIFIPVFGIAIEYDGRQHYKYVEHYEEALKTNHQGHSWKLSQLANDALTEDIKKIIRLAGSEGKA